jgi:hypothetical protein
VLSGAAGSSVFPQVEKRTVKQTVQASNFFVYFHYGLLNTTILSILQLEKAKCVPVKNSGAPFLSAANSRSI